MSMSGFPSVLVSVPQSVIQSHQADSVIVHEIAETSVLAQTYTYE